MASLPNRNIIRHHQQPEHMIIDSNDPEEIYRNKIPCDLCGELYDVSEFASHQVSHS